MNTQKRRAPRHVLLTGAAAGLGAGIAERLAQEGYHLSVTLRPGGTSEKELLRRLPKASQLRCYQLDVADTTACTELIARIEAEDAPIDILVHSVGPFLIERINTSNLESFRSLLASNCESAVALSLALLPHMRAQHFGRFVFFGMTGSSVTRPACGMAFYGAAKAALTVFARTLALEEARHGITSNLIEPGDIREKRRVREEALQIPDHNPSGAAGSWEDIADAVSYLISERARFVNGAILAVGGGLIDAGARTY